MTAVGPKMPRMALLDDIGCPDDVRKLTTKQAEDLAEEIRAFLIDKVSRTGGHLGPNLGVVELTIALHRVFDSPQRQIISEGLRHTSIFCYLFDIHSSLGATSYPGVVSSSLRELYE